jgi:hypothetical protein
MEVIPFFYPLGAKEGSFLLYTVYRKMKIKSICEIHRLNKFIK